MATLLTGILSGVGTVAKGIGSVAGGLGKGFLGGAGEAAGLGQIVKPATMAMKNPVTGVISQVAEPSSIWNKIGSALGEQAMKGGGSAPSSPALPSLPSTDTSTSVSQSRGYQPPQKKQAELERLLRELARR
jgi:hypothetical protein